MKLSRCRKLALLLGLAQMLAFTGCSLELLGTSGGSGGGGDGGADDDSSAHYLDAGTLPPVAAPLFADSDTHMISESDVSAKEITGTCQNGTTIYALDDSTDELLASASCAAGQFTLSVDFTDYADGIVIVKVTQATLNDSSSAFLNITFQKDTSYCSNVANKGAMPNGAGTAMSPFLICTAEQMSNTFDAPNNGSHFHLKNDIDAGAYPAMKGRFLSGGDDFFGTLEGNHFIIRNYSGDRALIDSVFTGGVIQNLKLRDFNVSFSVAANAAVLVRHYNGTTFNNVSAVGTASFPDMGTPNSSGILIGMANQSISNSWVSADITVASQTTFHKIGWIAGFMDGGTTLSNCFASGALTSPSPSSLTVGGLIGIAGNFWSAASHIISNSYAEVSIVGTKYAGGLVGQNASGGQLDIAGSGFEGRIYSSTAGTGGLVGITFGRPVGVANSYAIAEMEQSEECIGGLLGVMADNSTITNSFFRGTVLSYDGGGSSKVGGLSGCTGDSTIIESSYAVAYVSGSGDDAGLLGGTPNGSKISFSFFQGEVTSTGDALTNDGTAVVTGSYYDSIQASSMWGSGITTVRFADELEFVGFTFGGSPWIMGTSHPQLYFEF